jgi:hypothetical protein
MTNVINLRQQRKSKARKEKEKTADANRRVHGRTKAEKQKAAKESAISKRNIDGHKRNKNNLENNE